MLDVMRSLTRATENVPKFIDPQTHKMLDWIVAGTYFAAAVFFARRHRGAAIAAAINGGAVLGATLMTDYDGDGRRPISFPMHGVIDAGQMTFAGAAPALFGFQNRKEAILFQAQAASEAAVIAGTDWEAAAGGGMDVDEFTEELQEQADRARQEIEEQYGRARGAARRVSRSRYRGVA